PVMETYFNLADVFQWAGAILISWILLARDRLLWHPASTRHNYLIRPREQLRMALQFSFIAFCCSLLLGVFSFTFFNTLFGHFIAHAPDIRTTFFITFCSLSLLFCTFVFFMGIVISHRTAGPLYAFEM